VVAVGTTTCRALETWARTGKTFRLDRPLHHPGLRIQGVKSLVTNFHVPRARC
jgi:S-adenosylmethionine:tRNA-ribosyltransferase-isomerase (queuine synthetase)